MSQRQFIILAGIWIILLPFLGFPSTFDIVLEVFTGIFLIITAYRLRLEKMDVPEEEKPFVDHKSVIDEGIKESRS